jgi:hypothetical protein
LLAAIAESHSWRGVMRQLGCGDTSPSVIKAARRDALRLGAETGHFRGKRTWTDSALRRAITDACSWAEVAAALGLASIEGNDRVRVRAHAARLGLDLSRVEAPTRAAAQSAQLKRPTSKHLRDAGPAVATMWFLLCGYKVAFPIEPASFDLLVSWPGGVMRVQVKTTTMFSKGAWTVRVGWRPYTDGNRGPMVPYDPEEIDHFFVLDGDFNIYLIPSTVVGGRVAIVLSNYSEYIVGSIASVLADGPQAA